MYLTYRKENRTFASIGLFQWWDTTLTGLGEPEQLSALRVTDGTLQTLGVEAMLGRWFTSQEYGPAAEAPEPVILSYAFWQRRFGSDEAVLGREISMEAPTGSGSRQWRVVGIMPRGFRFLDMTPQPDVIIAWQIDPAKEAIHDFSYHMLARLKSGVTLAKARADIERMLPIWLDAWPTSPGLSKEEIANWRITTRLRPLKDDLVGNVASTLWVLMGAIGAVLLIACANIANLMLVRSAARRREFAVRGALGATPTRIARELLTESFILGTLGGPLGLVLAYLGVQLLVTNGPRDLPRLQEIAVYPPVLAFAFVVSLASTVVFGSISALKHALHMDTPMSGPMRGGTASRERSATRSALVVVQVALALALVVSAALMVRTFQALHDVDPGFSDGRTIQTAAVLIPPTLVPDPQQVTRMQHAILDKIAALPGVASVGFATHVPMDGWRGSGAVVVEGETIGPGQAPPLRRLNYVSPGYFQAMDTRIVAGRDITWSDIETGGRVAFISEDFARDVAGSPAAALGRRIRFSVPQAAWHEVIGVVQSVHQDGLYQDPPSTVYWPVLIANRFEQRSVAFAIRSERAGTASFKEEVRQAVRSVNGSVLITQERRMQDYYADSLARTSFTLVMLAIAGSMALALGVIGIYGVIAYVVAQRTREIGIRSALGAEPRQLARMFLLHGLALSALGGVVGLIAALTLGRLMSALLFGIGPMDPAAYAAALGIVIATTALASYLPARRAADIDPIETLRAE